MDKSSVEKVYNLLELKDDVAFAHLVKEALDVIEMGLDKYGVDGVSISFNGGKDCTVLLHLFAAILANPKYSPPEPKAISGLYIPCPSPFPALESFIKTSSSSYNLDLFQCIPPAAPDNSLPVENVVDGKQRGKGGESMKRGLEVYKVKYPNIEAILVGTRRGDPHGAKLSHFNQTDPGWPIFERINPIINWSYTDVWKFLRTLDVPYCELYDQGYTSLGSTFNTFPNPALLIPESPKTPEADTQPRYKPAYELVDGKLEREGRGSVRS